jgi:hypothetical protein
MSTSRKIDYLVELYSELTGAGGKTGGAATVGGAARCVATFSSGSAQTDWAKKNAGISPRFFGDKQLIFVCDDDTQPCP